MPFRRALVRISIEDFLIKVLRYTKEQDIIEGITQRAALRWRARWDGALGRTPSGGAFLRNRSREGPAWLQDGQQNADHGKKTRYCLTERGGLYMVSKNEDG